MIETPSTNQQTYKGPDTVQTVVLTVGETGWWMEDVTGCEDNQIMGIFSPPRHKYALRNNFIVPQPPHIQPSVWYLYSPNIGGERVHSVAVAN